MKRVFGLVLLLATASIMAVAQEPAPTPAPARTTTATPDWVEQVIEPGAIYYNPSGNVAMLVRDADPKDKSLEVYAMTLDFRQTSNANMAVGTKLKVIKLKPPRIVPPHPVPSPSTSWRLGRLRHVDGTRYVLSPETGEPMIARWDREPVSNVWVGLRFPTTTGPEGPFSGNDWVFEEVKEEPVTPEVKEEPVTPAQPN